MRKIQPKEDTKLEQLIDAEADLRRKVEERAKSHILPFTLYTFPKTYRVNWHHRRICDLIMRWIRGEIPYLIISVPPRHGKTEICSKRLPAFLFGLFPDTQIIMASYSADLSSKNNRSVQAIIDSNRYQTLFPNTRLWSAGGQGSGLMSGMRPRRTSTEFEIVKHEGYLRSAGVGGGITGMGAKFLIIDDPVKDAKQADSEVFRQSVWDWWSSTALTRLEDNSRALIIMTRWHEEDLAGRLLSESKNNPDALQFVEFKLEAIREDMTVLDDPRPYAQALWPEKYDEKYLKSIRSGMDPRWWNALFQQRPSALEGGIIQKKWIEDNYYRTLPPFWSRLIQSWDFTFKDTKHSDFVVGQVWGVYGKDKYLIDQVRARMGFTEAKKAMKAMSQKWPRAYKKIVEDKANGPAIIDALKNNDDGFGLEGIVPYSPKDSKEARLSAVSPAYMAGDVKYPHPEIAPWIQVNIDEIVKFPNAAYDDTVDSSTQALLDLCGGPGNTLKKMAVL